VLCSLEIIELDWGLDVKDIFLSRPSWINPRFQEGIDNFYNLLKSNDLNPRTIGQSDYPNESPLDEVIKLMEKCYGTIILGIPQIEITNGKIRGEDTRSTIELGTEWNHIEAALAHSIGQQILIIHHKTVQRGIFDRGAINCYLYNVDMNDSSWPITSAISGALMSWKSKLTQLLQKRNKVEADSKKPIIKWGMYQFPGEQGLFCPVCYVKSGLKIPASRINSKSYQCPNCKAILS
jgi:hypothetical protein